MTPPPTIHILSDDTELEFSGILTSTVNKTKMYQYTYTRSKEKFGQLLELNLEDLEKLIKQNTV